jgi:hypothetical protein
MSLVSKQVENASALLFAEGEQHLEKQRAL